MRIILFLTLGFASACALGVYVLESSMLIACCIAALIGSLICLLIPVKPARIAFVILLGVSLGFLRMHCYDASYLSRLRSLDGQTVFATVTATDYSYQTDYGISADGSITLDGKSYRIRIYTNGSVSLSPGDRMTGQIKIQTTTAGGAAESDYHQGMGVFLVGHFPEKPEIVKADQLEWKYYPAALRMKILQLLDRCFPADTRGFARALLLGDSRLITYEEDAVYKTSGIRHVIAVSGLHVSILFSLVYMAVGKRRFWTALLGIPVLVLFAAVAGFTPSVVRACAMQCLMILAMLLNREYDPPTALASAVLLMLLNNPMAVLSVSLQLSVGSMAGVFLFCRRLHDWAMAGKLGEIAKGKDLKARALWWCISSAMVTLSAMTLTVPLSAYYFGVVSLVGILTNMLCLWMVSGIFYGIMLVCLIGAVWTAGGQMIAGIISVPIRLVGWISDVLSGAPLAAVYTCSKYIALWLILSYCLFALFLRMKKKRPLVFAAAIIFSLLLAIGMSWLEPVAGNCLVTVMDVGQGQCVLLRCGGRNYLVDCGGEDGEQVADKAANLLLSQGIVALDGIILTHYDADHANGVERLMHRVPADALFLPDAPDSTDFRAALTEDFSDRIIWVNTDMQIEQGDYRISLFAGALEKEGNESGLCVLFQRQNCDILITGDRSTRMEDALLEKWKLPQLELLVVGHHGSGSSTGLGLLAQTRPGCAVISVGKDNTFGHPAPETLARLELYGCKVYRTDIHGDIHFGR